MVQQRKLEDGTILKRIRSPYGTGHVYSINGGPDGDVIVMDTYLNSIPHIAACLAWSLEKDQLQEYTPRDPQPVFNKLGWSH